MPKRCQLVIANRFYKDLMEIHPQEQQRILDALRKSKEDPSKGRKVIVAETGRYRCRAGSYRMRYDIEEDKVCILRVRHRRQAYRG